jgi:hypothetical protein
LTKTCDVQVIDAEGGVAQNIADFTFFNIDGRHQPPSCFFSVNL